MIRTVVLFTHVVGVVAMFIGLALEWVSVASIRRASTRAEVAPWLHLSAAVPRVSGIAVATVVLSGFYLGARVGVLGEGWMIASYAALLLMAVAGGALAGPRLGALHRAAAREDSTVTTLHALAADPRLRASQGIRTAFGLAVVYLMIGKPDAASSVVVLGIAFVAAVLMSLAGRPVPSTLVERRT